jgi:DNA-binding NtrC family response regulator
MKASELHLLDLLDFVPNEGSIRFNERRMLLWDADAFGNLRQELVESLGSAQARPILKRFGFANGYRDALTTKSLVDWKSDEEWWLACPSLQRNAGKVKPDVKHLSIDREQQIFEMEVEWTHSYEVEQHNRVAGPASEPVCWTLAGFASGFATALMGEECIVIETECAAMGGSCCRVVGKTRKAWLEEGDRVAKDYQAQPLANELDARARELRERSAQLAIRQREEERVSKTIAADRPPTSNSPEMDKVLSLCDTVAQSDSIVLISGESGTGKAEIASYLHAKGENAEGPLLSINCGALPEALLNSELFGHEAGALPGAATAKVGLFEQAQGGTLLLEEVGQMSPTSQVALLRAIQENEIWPVGANTPRAIDLRVLATSSRDLGQLTPEGRFRHDLYYRLNVMNIEVPPLRLRTEDILPLARGYLVQACERNGLEAKTLSPKVAETLAGHSWPGNLTELRNAMERAVILAGSKAKVEVGHLSPSLRSIRGDFAKVQHDQVLSMAEIERRYVLEVLERYRGNRTRTAKALGIGANTLWRKLKGWGVPPARGDSAF